MHECGFRPSGKGHKNNGRAHLEHFPILVKHCQVDQRNILCTNTDHTEHSTPLYPTQRAGINHRWAGAAGGRSLQDGRKARENGQGRPGADGAQRPRGIRVAEGGVHVAGWTGRTKSSRTTEPSRVAMQAQEGGIRGRREVQRHGPLLRGRERQGPRYQGPRGGGKDLSGESPSRILSMHMIAGMEIGGQAAEGQQGKRRRREPENGSLKDGDRRSKVRIRSVASP